MIDKDKILDATDPVCGIKINPQKAQFDTKIGDESYYFCSEDCLKKFYLDPSKYRGDDERDD